MVPISKECICVCLCELGFSLSSDCLISNVILLWFLSALIYVICCYGNMYSLASLPISFLASLLMEVCSTPLLLLCLN